MPSQDRKTCANQGGKVKRISQTDLATSIKASREAIGKYERNEATPSVETAKKIADVFEVTLDFLIDETANASFDKQTVKRLKDIENLTEDDKKILFAMIDAFLRDAKARKAYYEYGHCYKFYRPDH